MTDVPPTPDFVSQLSELHAAAREVQQFLTELDRRSRIGHAKWCVSDLGCVCGYREFVKYAEARFLRG